MNISPSLEANVTVKYEDCAWRMGEEIRRSEVRDFWYTPQQVMNRVLKTMIVILPL